MKKKLVNKLSKILKNDPLFAGRLSSDLGYCSSSTITNWVKRESIPQRQLIAVSLLIEKYLKKKA